MSLIVSNCLVQGKKALKDIGKNCLGGLEIQFWKRPGAITQSKVSHHIGSPHCDPSHRTCPELGRDSHHWFFTSVGPQAASPGDASD